MSSRSHRSRTRNKSIAPSNAFPQSALAALLEESRPPVVVDDDEDEDDELFSQFSLLSHQNSMMTIHTSQAQSFGKLQDENTESGSSEEEEEDSSSAAPTLLSSILGNATTSLLSTLYAPPPPSGVGIDSHGSVVSVQKQVDEPPLQKARPIIAPVDRRKKSLARPMFNPLLLDAPQFSSKRLLSGLQEQDQESIIKQPVLTPTKSFTEAPDHYALATDNRSYIQEPPCFNQEPSTAQRFTNTLTKLFAPAAEESSSKPQTSYKPPPPPSQQPQIFSRNECATILPPQTKTPCNINHAEEPKNTQPASTCLSLQSSTPEEKLPALVPSQQGHVKTCTTTDVMMMAAFSNRNSSKRILHMSAKSLVDDSQDSVGGSTTSSEKSRKSYGLPPKEGERLSSNSRYGLRRASYDRIKTLMYNDAESIPEEVNSDDDDNDHDTPSKVSWTKRNATHTAADYLGTHGGVYHNKSTDEWHVLLADLKAARQAEQRTRNELKFVDEQLRDLQHEHSELLEELDHVQYQLEKAEMQCEHYRNKPPIIQQSNHAEQQIEMHILNIAQLQQQLGQQQELVEHLKNQLDETTQKHAAAQAHHDSKYNEMQHTHQETLKELTRVHNEEISNLKKNFNAQLSEQILELQQQHNYELYTEQRKHEQEIEMLKSGLRRQSSPNSTTTSSDLDNTSQRDIGSISASHPLVLLELQERHRQELMEQSQHHHAEIKLLKEQLHMMQLQRQWHETTLRETLVEEFQAEIQDTHFYEAEMERKCLELHQYYQEKIEQLKTSQESSGSSKKIQKLCQEHEQQLRRQRELHVLELEPGCKLTNHPLVYEQDLANCNENRPLKQFHEQYDLINAQHLATLKEADALKRQVWEQQELLQNLTAKIERLESPQLLKTTTTTTSTATTTTLGNIALQNTALLLETFQQPDDMPKLYQTQTFDTVDDDTSQSLSADSMVVCQYNMRQIKAAIPNLSRFLHRPRRSAAGVISKSDDQNDESSIEQSSTATDLTTRQGRRQRIAMLSVLRRKQQQQQHQDQEEQEPTNNLADKLSTDSANLYLHLSSHSADMAAGHQDAFGETIWKKRHD